MGTRSRIGVMHGDKLKSVYCHWDGYLAYNGQLLQNHYDSAKANHLVSLGNISSLKAEIGENMTLMSVAIAAPSTGVTVVSRLHLR